MRLTIVVHADACLQGLGLTVSEYSEVKPIGKPELVHKPGENSGLHNYPTDMIGGWVKVGTYPVMGQRVAGSHLRKELIIRWILALQPRTG